MSFLFAMGFATYLFRAFRDLTPHDFYPLVIGTMLVSVLIVFIGYRQDVPFSRVWLGVLFFFAPKQNLEQENSETAPTNTN
jgi:hypothetical protein